MHLNHGTPREAVSTRAKGAKFDKNGDWVKSEDAGKVTNDRGVPLNNMWGLGSERTRGNAVSDLDDFKLRGPDPGPDEFDEDFVPALESPERPAPRGIHPAVPFAALGLGMLLIGLYFMFRPSTPASPPSPAPVATTVSPAPTPVIESASPAPAPLDLPPLGQSDAMVRGWVAALSTNPGFARWLIPDELIRMFVVTIENIADGENPSTHIKHLRPATAFPAAGTTGQLFLDPQGFARFNGLAAVAGSINARDAARLFQNLRPLFDEAYAELGHPAGSFDATFARALGRLLETPAAPGRIALVRRTVSFHFADPRLEALAPAQKVLIRMGPANRAKVQGKLEEFRAVLEAAKRAEG